MNIFYIFLVGVLRRLGLLPFVNIVIRLRLSGLFFRIPIRAGMGRENIHMSEMWMISVLKTVLPITNGVFVDVGVNMGQTLLKLKAVDSTRDYIGFEPNPNCVSYVSTLIIENGFKNTTVVPSGVSDINQLLELNFYSPGAADSSASVISNFRPQQVYRREWVVCLNFETLAPALAGKKIALIKIDVEGAEELVLRTLRECIKIQRPFVLVEILPVYSIENTDRLNRQRSIEQMAKELRFKICRIGKSKAVTFRVLECIDINPQIQECDYLLCPEERIVDLGEYILN